MVSRRREGTISTSFQPVNQKPEFERKLEADDDDECRHKINPKCGDHTTISMTVVWQVK